MAEEEEEEEEEEEDENKRIRPRERALGQKMGSQRRLPQHKRVHTMRVKNHHNLNIILG